MSDEPEFGGPVSPEPAAPPLSADQLADIARSVGWPTPPPTREEVEAIHAAPVGVVDPELPLAERVERIIAQCPNPGCMRQPPHAIPDECVVPVDTPPPTDAPTRDDPDFVILPRDALFEFFGQVALPPGSGAPSNTPCAPIAERIVDWIREHDLSGVWLGVRRG